MPNVTKAKIINQSKFEEILQKELKSTTMGKISLADLLEKHGYQAVLKDINLCIANFTITQPEGLGKKVTHTTGVLERLDFSRLKLDNCEAKHGRFEGVNFSDVELKNCNFESATFNGSSFNKSTITNCNFDKASFNSASFDNCYVRNSRFKLAEFIGTKFINAMLENNIFEKSVLIKTVEDKVIANSNRFNNCVGLVSNSQLLTRMHPISRIGPTSSVVAILWDHNKPGIAGSKLYNSIINRGEIPIRISYLPEDVNTDRLSREIDSYLDIYQSLDKEYQQQNSRAMHVLACTKRTISVSNAAEINKVLPANNSESLKLIARIDNLIPYIDGLILPGGPDIPSQLYGQDKHPKSAPEDNYVRSILEFELLDRQRSLGFPLLGICRGMQISAVFYGGDMLQSVPDSGNFKSLDNIGNKSGKTGFFTGPLSKKPMVLSVHHQAVDPNSKYISEAIEVVADLKNIPKAMSAVQNSPLMLLQFHPEFEGEKFVEIYESINSTSLGCVRMLAALGNNIAAKPLAPENQHFFDIFYQTTRTHVVNKKQMQEIETFDKTKLKKVPAEKVRDFSDKLYAGRRNIITKKEIKPAPSRGHATPSSAISEVKTGYAGKTKQVEDSRPLTKAPMISLRSVDRGNKIAATESCYMGIEIESAADCINLGHIKAHLIANFEKENVSDYTSKKGEFKIIINDQFGTITVNNVPNFADFGKNTSKITLQYTNQEQFSQKVVKLAQLAVSYMKGKGLAKCTLKAPQGSNAKANRELTNAFVCEFYRLAQGSSMSLSFRDEDFTTQELLDINRQLIRNNKIT